MNIHEYQAKELLKIFNVPIAKGVLVEDPEDAIDAAKTVSDNLWVVKAQIHAGGRGKGGGVKIAKSLEEVKSLSSEIIGMNLVTHQTGKDGKRVRKIYIEAGTDIAEEFYISMVVDRQTSKISFIASTEGGVDIEEVAKKTPEKIITVNVEPTAGVTNKETDLICKSLGLEGDLANQAEDLCNNLYSAFLGSDMSLLEINPLVITSDRKIICLDAKVNFDDNALFRHPNFRELLDPHEEDPSELKRS